MIPNYPDIPNDYRCIYALIDPRTEKVHYVGQTKNTQKRLIKHFCDRARSTEPLRQWIEYLWESKYKPVLIVLEIAKTSDINVCERKWVLYYQEKGEPITNYNLTVKKRKKQRPMSDETKIRISKAKLGKTIKGHAQTEETKRKISETKIRTGCNIQTSEWTEKIASQQRGIPWSEEKRAKIMTGVRKRKLFNAEVKLIKYQLGL